MASGQQGKNSNVLVWDIATRQAVFRFEEHDHQVSQIAFSPDDRLLVTIGNAKDGRIICWDLATGKVVCRGAQADRRFDVSAVAWSPVAPVLGGDTYSLATATGASVHIFTINPFVGTMTMEPVNRGSVCKPINSLLFAADAVWLYAGSSSGEVITVNVQRRAMQLCHPVGKGGVLFLKLHRGKVMVGCGDGSVIPFSHAHMRYTCVADVNVDGPVASIGDVDTAGGYVVATTTGCIFKVQPKGAGAAATRLLMKAQLGDVLKAAFAPGSSDAFATCSRSGSIEVWNLGSATMISQVTAKDAGAALCVALQRDVVVGGYEDGMVRAYARAGRELTLCWQIPNAHSFLGACGVCCLSFGPGARFLATAGVGGEVRVWDGRSRRMISNVKAHGSVVTSLQSFADSQHLLSSSMDCVLLVSNIETEKKMVTFVNRSGPLNDMCLAPDQVVMTASLVAARLKHDASAEMYAELTYKALVQTHVMTVGNDRSLTIWDLRDPDPAVVIRNAHAQNATCVACHPSGAIIATGGADMTVRIWDFRSGNMLGEYAGHSGIVMCLAFSPDGSSLVSGATDGDLLVWNVAL